MRRPGWIMGRMRGRARPAAEGQERPAAQRDRLAVMMAAITVVYLGAALAFSKGTQVLMPGPLASVHGAIDKCGSCHTKSGRGKLSWLHGLVAGDPEADSKACLTCHKMPDTALNPHGATASILNQSTERLSKAAAAVPQPRSARAQSFAFPTGAIMERGLFCATCHQEHQGTNAKLSTISNEQCRSCHVMKFDSFDGDHPKFENYPFKRRTRIVYDHAAHFNKHYPEVAKKDPAKRIPATCSTCHDSRGDKRIMAVAPFEQTCSGCHLDQINGKERVSGPKGIAFLALPGLDLDTLKKAKAPIGEWPDGSDAALTPFMKIMIGRNEQGRALLEAVDGLNLQDLANANAGQIKAVTELAWTIKRLFHALISAKASDALADLTIDGGAKLSATLVADLTASIPRDVIVGAQQQWLPNLAKEIAGGPIADQQPAATEPEPSAAKAADAAQEEPAEPDKSEASTATPAPSETASLPKRDPPACSVRVFGQCLVFKAQAEPPAASAGDEDAPRPAKKTPSAGVVPDAMQAGLRDVVVAAAEKSAADAKVEQTPAAGRQLPAKAGGQADELLFPTEDEQREIKEHNKNSGKKDQPGAAPTGSAGSGTPAGAQPQSEPGIESGIEGGIDAESWAEYGGWYQQDQAIFYRPSGHKDKFIASWLTLTGPQAAKGSARPAAAVFEALTGKDAQGSCTKCHSIDDSGKGRTVNFSPLSAEAKQGNFTRFVHEPHFGVTGDRGCLTCHELEKGRPYLKSYEQNNPQSFAAEFSAVKKERCQGCHTGSKARQDCLTCHAYHVNGVITPITATKLPAQ